MPSSGMLLIHMFALAMYRNTMSQAPESEAYVRVFGKRSPNPTTISTTPENKTQNFGTPRREGTIGMYQSGFRKWSIPMKIRAIPIIKLPINRSMYVITDTIHY